MAAYDLVTLAGTECVQWTGANDADVLAVCPDARFDPTEERVAKIPATHNRTRLAFVGEWITSVEPGEYLVFPDASFAALFQAS